MATGKVDASKFSLQYSFHIRVIAIFSQVASQKLGMRITLRQNLPLASFVWRHVLPFAVTFTMLSYFGYSLSEYYRISDYTRSIVKDETPMRL